MRLEALERWLQKRLRHDANVSLIVSPLALLGGLLVLFLTFWLSYVVILLVSRVVLSIPQLFLDTRWRLGHTGRLWLAGGFLVLLMISYLRSDRSGVDWSAWDDDPSALGEAVARFGAGAGRASLLLAYPEMSAKIIVDLLNTGPRLLSGGLGLLRQGSQTRGADTEAGARVLWTLLSCPGLVTYPELQTAYETPELTRAFHALRLVDGVTFLERGVSLTQELRAELIRVAG